MRALQPLKVQIVFLILVACGGCATNATDLIVDSRGMTANELSQAATLTAMQPNNDFIVFFDKLDGHAIWDPIQSLAPLGTNHFPGQLRLSPGKHTFHVWYNKQPSGLSPAVWVGFDIWLVARPNEKYVLHYESHGETYDPLVRMWITDSSGTDTGGYIGSQDEPKS